MPYVFTGPKHKLRILETRRLGNVMLGVVSQSLLLLVVREILLFGTSYASHSVIVCVSSVLQLVRAVAALARAPPPAPPLSSTCRGQSSSLRRSDGGISYFPSRAIGAKNMTFIPHLLIALNGIDHWAVTMRTNGFRKDGRLSLNGHQIGGTSVYCGLVVRARTRNALQFHSFSGWHHDCSTGLETTPHRPVPSLSGFDSLPPPPPRRPATAAAASNAVFAATLLGISAFRARE